MDDFISKIRELEEEAKNNGNEYAVNPAIFPFTNLKQSRISQIYQIFYESQSSSAMKREDIMKLFSHFKEYNEDMIKDFIDIFLLNDSKYCDGFEILFILILFSDTTEIIKIEDLFDTCHFLYEEGELDNSLTKEEFILSMKSIVSGIAKIYGLNDFFKEEDIFIMFNNIFENGFREGKVLHERFVQFIKDDKKWLYKFISIIEKYNEREDDDDYVVENFNPKPIPVEATGDEFMAIKPWKGAIREPTTHNVINPSAPNVYFNLGWVYGYRGYDCRNNLYYTANDNVVYHTAGVGILYNRKNKKQEYNLDHDDDIICLAIDSSRQYIATGQLGKHPKVVVWKHDCPNDPIFELKAFHKRAVLCVAFSPNGQYLATVGQDNDHKLAVYKLDYENSKSKMIATCTLSKSKILDCRFISDNKIVACADKEVRIINFDEKNLDNKKGLFKKFALDTVLCICPSNNQDEFLTGTKLGNIYRWKNNAVVENYPNIHKGGVFCIIQLKDGGFVTGGRDGNIKFWNSEMKTSKVINVVELVKQVNTIKNATQKQQIRSICISSDQKYLLVGTNLSEIYEIGLDRDAIVGEAITTGHYKDELWGLAVSPDYSNEIVTAGDDHTLRIWDSYTHNQIKGIELPTISRACAFLENYIICGLGGSLEKATRKDKEEGTVLAINTDNMKIVKKVKNTSKWISDIKVSKHEIIAVGSHDNYIYLYKGKGLEYFSRLKGHNSYITHFDFSIDGNYLQSNCGAYELLFWDVDGHKQFFPTKKSDKIENIKWLTQTCVLGWGVQGIWPECSDGTDINAVDLSKSGKILATADDFGLVKLFNYPCVEKNSSYIEGKGHSSHVTNVRFSIDSANTDSTNIYSVGGNDKSLFQWNFECDVDEITRQNNDEENREILNNDKLEIENHDINVADPKGDEFMAVKPWLGAIKKPSPEVLKTYGKINPAKPNAEIDINWVYGYQSQLLRDNLRYNSQGNIVYNIAALGIIYDKKNNKQLYNDSHSDDIVSLAIHPTLSYIATGQLGSNPKIVIWNTENGDTVKELINFHKRSIDILSFNGSGNLLASIGGDNNHTVAIYDWNKGIIKASSKGEPAKVLGACWGDNVFAQCGDKHIKFWEMQGKSLSSRKGLLLGNDEKGVQQVFPCMCFSKAKNAFVVGTTDGCLYIFSKRSLSKIIKVSKSPIMCMSTLNDRIICGNKKGLIYLYDEKLENPDVIDLPAVVKENKINQALNPTYEIRSVCISSNEKNILIGTRASNVYEYNIENKKIELLVSGHCKDELWGLAINPTNPKEMISVGDDSTLRVWDTNKHTVTECISLPTMSRAISYDYKGSSLLVGLGGRVGRGKNKKDGSILLYSIKKGQLTLKDHKEDAKDWISDVKFNKASDKCAVGSHDNNIYIYSISSQKFGQCQVLKGHNSYITHFDFSVDGNYLQSNCGAYELLFWNLKNGTQAKKSDKIENIKWLTQTCVLGWSVQKIWPECSDGTDINALDVCMDSKDGNLLATADDFGLVKLFNYPCVENNSGYIEGKGHSSHVTNVKFINNDDQKICVSAGGNDRSLIQWNITIDNEEQGGETDTEYVPPVREDEAESLDQFEMPSGDEFMAVKPWLGSIFAPTTVGKIDSTLPDKKLRLHTVFGYTAQNCRNNLRYNKMGDVIYHSAAVGVIQPIKSPQLFNTNHTDDITCLCIDPSLNYVATGEMGNKPLINIWDSSTGELVSTIKGFHRKGINALAFSPNGDLLATVGSDPNHSVAVYGAVDGVWDKPKMMGSNKGDTNNTLFVSWLNDSVFMTGGVKHGNFWNAGSVTCKRALFKNQPIDTLICATAINETTMVAGTSKGKLYIYQNSQCKEAKELHKSKVYSIYHSENYLFSGSDDGLIGIWDNDMNLLSSIKLSEVYPKDVLKYSIISICCNPNEDKLLIGTASSDIIQFTLKDNQISDGLKLQTGHYENELWGVAPYPLDFTKAVTVGDDKTLRIWNISKRKCENIIELPRMSRCITFSDNGKLLCVGLGGRLGGTKKTKEKNENIGGFIVYEYPSMKELHCELNMSKQQVSEIKISPKGQYLAVGSHDNSVYIYSTKNYKLKGKCTAGHSTVTHFDFSEDSQYLQVTYADYELLFYDIKGNHINKPSKLRDVKWATQTCVLGWPVQGIWADTSDGTDINYVDRSHSGDLLVSGDDFGKVRLYRYPVLSKEHQYSKGVGHSSHVPECKFTKNDRYVLSTGGNDRALMVWKLESE